MGLQSDGRKDDGCIVSYYFLRGIYFSLEFLERIKVEDPILYYHLKKHENVSQAEIDHVANKIFNQGV